MDHWIEGPYMLGFSQEDRIKISWAGFAVPANMREDLVLFQWAEDRGSVTRVDRAIWAEYYKWPHKATRTEHAIAAEAYRERVVQDDYLMRKVLPKLLGRVISCFCFPWDC